MMGRKKYVIIETIRRKRNYIFCTPPICFYPYWERLKSIFKFKRAEAPESLIDYRGQRCEISFKDLTPYAN